MRRWGVCRRIQCRKLRDKLVELLGEDWRRTVFANGIPDEIDLNAFHDIFLLLGLAEPQGPQLRLYQHLGRQGWTTRFASRLVRAWQHRGSERSFPPPAVAGRILECVRRCSTAGVQCLGMRVMGLGITPLLSLLQMRLGCVLATGACCTLVCRLGSDSARIAAPPMGMVMVADFFSVDPGFRAHIRATKVMWCAVRGIRSCAANS